jgi:hypothetical protein
MTYPRLSNSPPAFPQIRARLALPTDGRPQQDSNLRTRLWRPKPSKSWTRTDLPVEPLSGRDRGVARRVRRGPADASRLSPTHSTAEKAVRWSR